MSGLEGNGRGGGLDKIGSAFAPEEKGKWRVAHFSGIIINRLRHFSRFLREVGPFEKWGLFAAMRLRYRRVPSESDVLVVCRHLVH